jgi:hypothetical protein
VVGGQELHPGANLGESADRHGGDVADHAVEVEEHPVADRDVRAVIAEEQRSDHRARADMAEELAPENAPLVGEAAARVAL